MIFVLINLTPPAGRYGALTDIVVGTFVVPESARMPVSLPCITTSWPAPPAVRPRLTRPGQVTTGCAHLFRGESEGPAGRDGRIGVWSGSVAVVLKEPDDVQCSPPVSVFSLFTEGGDVFAWDLKPPQNGVREGEWGCPGYRSPYFGPLSCAQWPSSSGGPASRFCQWFSECLSMLVSCNSSRETMGIEPATIFCSLLPVCLALRGWPPKPAEPVTLQKIFWGSGNHTEVG